MRRMTIKALLAILGGVTISGFIVTLALFALQSRHIGDTFENIINVEEALLGNLQEMYAQGLQTEQATRNVVLNPADETARKNYEKADGKFLQALEAARGLAKDDMAASLAPLPQMWRESGQLKREVMELAAAGRTRDATELLNTRETGMWRKIKAVIQKDIEIQAKTSKATYADYKASERLSFWLVIATGLVLLAAMAVLITLGGRMILRPLREIQDFALCQAHGDFENCRLGEFSGELHSVSEALRAMAVKVQESLGFTQGVLGGIASPFVVVDEQSRLTMTNQPLIDLIEQDGGPDDHKGVDAARFFYGVAARSTVLGEAMRENRTVVREVDLTGHKGGQKRIHISASPLFNTINGKLMGALCLYTDLTELRAKEAQVLAQNQAVTEAAQKAEAVVHSLLECSDRLTGRISNAEDGAAQQRERVGSTQQAMGDMSEAIHGVAESAEVAGGGAENARAKAGEGEGVVREVVTSVDDVRTQALALKDNMGELGRQAESIGQIMNVITDIADQTNLLALNAAIEAARAGDARRGFAVVADEVRKLAEKTMSATKEVGAAIGSIQQGTRTNVRQVDQAARSIERANELAGRSGTALSEIVGMVNDTAQRVRGIATAVELQAKASEQVNAAVDEISEIAMQTSAGMDEAARDVEELKKLADQLREVMDVMAKA